MNKSRNYGIEFLRLILMFMICVLHVLGRGGLLVGSENLPFKNSVFWAMEIFAFCAVDGFAIISGYVAVNKKKKYERIVDIWFQTFFYSFVVTIILMFAGIGSNLGIVDVIKCALPITFNKFWYITAYFALFFAMPIFNMFIDKLSVNSAKMMFLITIFIYSIIGNIDDCFQTSFGYSAIWLMILYCIGLLVKKIRLFENKSSLFLIFVWFICLFSTWFIKVYTGIGRLINYTSPTILFSGIIMVILFSRLKLKGNFISKISSLTLGIYLLQLNPIIWDYIIKDAFLFVVSKNIFIGVVYVLLFALLIFICGLIVEWFRSIIAKKIGLSSLSKKIVNWFNVMLVKLIILLD